MANNSNSTNKNSENTRGNSKNTKAPVRRTEKKRAFKDPLEQARQEALANHKTSNSADKAEA